MSTGIFKHVPKQSARESALEASKLNHELLYTSGKLDAYEKLVASVESFEDDLSVLSRSVIMLSVDDIETANDVPSLESDVSFMEKLKGKAKEVGETIWKKILAFYAWIKSSGKNVIDAAWDKILLLKSGDPSTEAGDISEHKVQKSEFRISGPTFERYLRTHNRSQPYNNLTTFNKLVDTDIKALSSFFNGRPNKGTFGELKDNLFMGYTVSKSIKSHQPLDLRYKRNEFLKELIALHATAKKLMVLSNESNKWVKLADTIQKKGIMEPDEDNFVRVVRKNATSLATLSTSVYAVLRAMTALNPS